MNDAIRYLHVNDAIRHLHVNDAIRHSSHVNNTICPLLAALTLSKNQLAEISRVLT